MKVKEAIVLAATQLGIADGVQTYLEENAVTEDGKRNAELLLTCFNIVENQLALDYLPLYAEDELYSYTGRVQFSDLTHSAVHLLKVVDEGENNTRFTLFPDCFKTKSGKLKVSYTYTPTPKQMTGESDYARLPTHLFAYGMAAEYATAIGNYEEAAVWDKKFKNALEAVYHATPSVKIRSRRWA